jgi:hypothetical protein
MISQVRPSGSSAIAGVFVDGDAGEIGDLLAKACEAIKKA